MILLGVEEKDGMNLKELLVTNFKGLSMESVGEDVVEYYFEQLGDLVMWLQMMHDEIRVPLIKPFYLKTTNFKLSDVIKFLTRYFALRITNEDTIDLIALYGNNLIITPDSKVWIDGDEINGINDSSQSSILITPLTDPEVLKCEVNRVSKALEHISLRGEQFELVAMWTGWFENYILTRNPKMIENIHFIRAFDRLCLSGYNFESKSQESLEQLLGLDIDDNRSNYYTKAYSEQVKLSGVNYYSEESQKYIEKLWKSRSD